MNGQDMFLFQRYPTSSIKLNQPDPFKEICLKNDELFFRVRYGQRAENVQVTIMNINLSTEW